MILVEYHPKISGFHAKNVYHHTIVIPVVSSIFSHAAPISCNCKVSFLLVVNETQCGNKRSLSSR